MKKIITLVVLALIGAAPSIAKGKIDNKNVAVKYLQHLRQVTENHLGQP